MRLIGIACSLVACIHAAPVMIENRSSAETNSTSGTRILIIGDSWGSISPATLHFEKELNEHSCKWSGFKNIAVRAAPHSEHLARSVRS